MKRTLLIIIFLKFSINIFAQQYGNEWINYSQNYYKIPIVSEGIYRIERQALLDAGFPVDNISLAGIQLFSKGVEQYIYVKTGSFNMLDYLEFYAKPNDGWLDSAMYDLPQNQISPYYSLINDTSSYFLTWNNSIAGKRLSIENDVNFSGYTPSPFCITNVNSVYSSFYYYAEDNALYTKGEGWFDNSFYLGGSVTKTISIPNIYHAGPVTEISFVVAGESNSTSTNGFNHHLQVDFQSTNFLDTTYTGYADIKKKIVVSSGSISSSINLTFRSINDLGVSADRNAVAYILTKYPHTFNFSNTSVFKFTLPDAALSKSYINISNFNAGSTIPVLYDLTNHKRITVVLSGSNYMALVPNSGGEKECYITSETAIKKLTQIKPITFTDFSVQGKNSDYIIISHPKLWSSATNYKNYRNSKGYHVLLANIEELYDQFAYGINKHPLAIKNFMNFLIHTYSTIPENLFIIGKSIYAKDYRNYVYGYQSTLVPSLGNPPSDILLTAGLNGTHFEPAVPTGRLAATSDASVEIYLKKVQDYESNLPEEWMKNILHFGGGANYNEQSIFSSYLNTYKKIIEDTLFGGNVTTIRKNSSAPIQISEADSIRNTINNGCSMITFFGHGSTSGFDQSTDYPENYSNKKKYPFILANSCYAGDIFLLDAYTINEEWIFVSEKGAIGFLASNDLGHTLFLDGYSNELYKNISYKNYGKGIGICIQNTIRTYQNTNIYDNLLTNTCVSFALHGDPAIVINSHTLPDLAVSNSSISYTPENVTNEIDSFQINIIITNIGRATTKSYIVEINRQFPDGSNQIISENVTGAYFKDTIRIKLPVNFIKGAGLNHICINVDAMGQITELSELNNNICVDLIIVSGDLFPVYPYNFSIYPNSTVTLKASTVDPFLIQQTNVFEFDTTDAFNSPFLQTHTFNSVGGGVISWMPSKILTDSTVYYWRVSKMPQGSSPYNWKESSFIYKPNKTGWSQAHFHQFKDDDYQFIEYNKPLRKFDFITTPRELHCHTGWINFFEMGYTIDGSGDNGCVGGQNALIVVVIDSATLIPWYSDKANYGHSDYPQSWSRNRPDYYFVYYADIATLHNMANLIKDTVPNGNYILVYTIKNGNFDSWDETLYQAFESLGSTKIRTVHNNIPYIFFCKKGYPNTVHEVLGSTTTTVIDMYEYLNTNFNYGNITSDLIGPAKNWKSLHWLQKPQEVNSQDSINLKIIGVLPNGNQNVLLNLPEDSVDFYNLQQYANSNIYPYLKLNFYTKDSANKTPSQLNKWQIEYDEVPETALNPSKGYYFSKDTLSEGDTLKFAIATENISMVNMDSLLITCFVKDKNNNFHTIIKKRLKPHPAGSILIDTIKFSTYGYAGLNSLWYEVNPVDSLTGNYDQPEQYHFNNLAEKFFYVTSDITNPLLDVSFDGIHIFNGDIVSSKPNILIKLKDENKFLALNDTSLFAIYLKSQSTGIEKRIHFGDDAEQEILKWIPAQLPDNSCQIIYSPEFSEDGIYELRVQAKDISNNESGANDYRIFFEIINKSTITEIFNYPNPFSTSTRFVFTLTGSEIPTDFRIQILTVTGKLVREIGLNELGNIHIGNNISDFAWDGTDMFGDKLANGVYFYRVITSINGKNIDKRDTGNSKYFKKDFGKMYLMR